MCGISGVVNKGGHSDKDEIGYLLERMSALLHHRGPDQQRVLLTGEGALACCRLQIVGGPESTQPLVNESRTKYLVCNGEIYNHQELRRSLERHRFDTESDCEVILHLYEEIGVDCVSHLKGQFAFAILDLDQRQLICARDRFGIHPFFYTTGPEHFLFASEAKALFADSRIAVSLDVQAVLETALLYGPTPPRTHFENVMQIPPAHFLVLSIDTWNIQVGKYWNLGMGSHLEQVKFDRDCLGEVTRLISKAVERRLQGESQLALYLSGGLDSSTIGYFLTKLSPKEVRPFSIQFYEQHFDESLYQEIFSDVLGFELKGLRCRDVDIADNLPKVVWHAEAPLTRTAPVPMYLLSREVQKLGIKVVLSGEGADEVFGGYPVFLSGMSSIEAKYQEFGRLTELFSVLFSDSIDRHAVDQYVEEVKGNFMNASKLTQSQALEINTKLSRYLLSTQGDRMSMAHSVEQRFPFLDEDLVSFVFEMPPSFRVNSQIGKFALREAMRHVLPIAIVERRKQGYLAPNRNPFISGRHLRGIYEDIMSDRTVRNYGYFDPVIVQQVKESFLTGSRSLSLSQRAIEAAFLLILTTHLMHMFFVERDQTLAR